MTHGNRKVRGEGITQFECLISAGTAQSAALSADGNKIIGIEFPANWTLAPLMFQVLADDGVSWLDLYDYATGSTFNIPSASITANPSRRINIDTKVLDGIRTYRVQSGTTAAPVNQAADRTLFITVDHAGG